MYGLKLDKTSFQLVLDRWLTHYIPEDASSNPPRENEFFLYGETINMKNNFYMSWFSLTV
jgi:hypothetical protein